MVIAINQGILLQRKVVTTVQVVIVAFRRETVIELHHQRRHLVSVQKKELLIKLIQISMVEFTVLQFNQHHLQTMNLLEVFNLMVTTQQMT